MKRGALFWLLIALAILPVCEIPQQSDVKESVQEPCDKSYLSKLREVFDELDSSVNDGRGYKDFLNPDGFPTGALLAWSESYLMQAYAEMFRATGDEYYLDKLYDHIESVMRNRDDFRGHRDYKGDLVPSWGTNRYTEDKAWLHFAVLTGMITYPMLEFVQIVREHRIKRLYEKAELVLARVQESIDYHNSEYVIQEKGFGLYTYPENYYHKSNYVLPIDQQAAIGRSLVLLCKLTQQKSYCNKAKDIALAIKGSFQKKMGKVYWGVNFGPISEQNPVEDISHATITVDFIRLAYEAGLVFNADDMQNIAYSIYSLLADGRAERYLDGSGDYAYEIAAGQYAILAPYEPKIWKLCYNILFEIYKVNFSGRYLQEDWWGTVMLGIARLAKYVKYAECKSSELN